MTFDALSPSLAQENLLTILLSTKWALIKTQLLQRLLIDAQFHEFLNYSKKLNLLKFMCSCVINSYFISLFTYSSFHSKKLHTPIHIHFLTCKNIFLNFNRANFVIKNIFLFAHWKSFSKQNLLTFQGCVFLPHEHFPVSFSPFFLLQHPCIRRTSTFKLFRSRLSFLVNFSH